MAADYGHFAEGSSTSGRNFRLVSATAATVATNMSQNKMPARVAANAARGAGSIASEDQLTPSFFCRLDDEVVYWNTRRLSG